MKARFFAAVVLALPLAAAAQSGEMWEITSQMNIPGMPAGMGAQTNRVCQGDDPERAAAEKKDRQDCKVVDKKQTANRLQVTMKCKDGTMTIDQQYNAARTEFKGVMKMTTKDGDMSINTTGRRVGACDVAQAKKEQKDQQAALEAQAAAAKAQGAAVMKKYADDQIKRCASALDNMQWAGFYVYGQCYKKTDAKCKEDMKTSDQMSPEIWKSCNVRVDDYCKRYQTQDGFLKARADATAAQACGVNVAAFKAAECPKAAKSQSLGFLGAYCPVEAKPIAQEHCAGRDYTSKMGGKYARFCESYLAHNSLEKPPASATQQTSDSVKQGINKLKGLFGR
ncbi:MAG TPA: DUF3617 family protein [Burkholderiales bacterium]|nr:DUF3617 family protein [Burkholderiales bacterium]